MQPALPEIPLVKSEIESVCGELLTLAVSPEKFLDQGTLKNICGDLGMKVSSHSGCLYIENGEEEVKENLRLLPASRQFNETIIGLGTLSALKSIRPGLSMARLLIPEASSLRPAVGGDTGKNIYYGTDTGLPAGKVSVASGMLFPASLKFTMDIPSGVSSELLDNSIAMMARLINSLGQSLSRHNDALAPVKIAYSSINSRENSVVLVEATAFILQKDTDGVRKFLESYVENFSTLYDVPCRFQVVESKRGTQIDAGLSQALRQSVSEIRASGLTELNEYFVLPLQHRCYIPSASALLLVGAGDPETPASQDEVKVKSIRAGIEALTWFCLKEFIS